MEDIKLCWSVGDAACLQVDDKKLRHEEEKLEGEQEWKKKETDGEEHNGKTGSM